MSVRTIVIFGGTGAQAGPIVEQLSATNNFKITVPTRSTSSAEAVRLAKLPNVSLLQATYDTEEGLRAAFAGQESCYFIINSFTTREPDEYFWTMRAFEIAVQSGVKHFIYSGAQNRLRESGFQEKYRNSHNTVKAHLSDWIRQQDTNVMGWTIVYGGPYAEMLGSTFCPLKMGDEYVFAAPVHGDSIVPLMPLENYGTTLVWVLENIEQANGKFLDAGALPTSWPELVAAFTNVTGKKARAMYISQEQWFEGAARKGMNANAQLPFGSQPGDPAAFTVGKTFGAWWNMWRDNTRKHEAQGRSIHAIPGRITSIEDWMRRTGYDGEPKEPTKMRRELANVRPSS